MPPSVMLALLYASPGHRTPPMNEEIRPNFTAMEPRLASETVGGDHSRWLENDWLATNLSDAAVPGWKPFGPTSRWPEVAEKGDTCQ
jgi:hypothetical protein